MNLNLKHKESTPTVIDLILKRKAEHSEPRRRHDRYKLGLAIEGGGMAGVVTAGMVTGLYALGFQNVFDAVYGSSGGASNGAYFLAGQPAYGTTIYYNHINNRVFIDPTRFLLGYPIVNLDFVFETVMKKIVVLDFQAIINSPIPLKILATSVSKERIETFENFRSQDELLKALHASAQMPIGAGMHPFVYRGELYWDAQLIDPTGAISALKDGCTHLLVLRSRPMGLPVPKMNRIILSIAGKNIRSYSTKLFDSYKANLRNRSPFGLEDGLEGLHLFSDSNLYSIMLPKEASDIGMMETNQHILKSGARAGLISVLQTFGAKNHIVVEVLEAVEDLGQSKEIK